MADDRGVDRRQFLIGGSTAIVGAASLVTTGAAAPAEARPEAPFMSPAGSRIPFSRADLLAPAAPRVFQEPHLSQIAFPLGGIGTGTVSLSGRGGLRDWEIFNRPNKNHSLPYTFVALRVKEHGGEPTVHVVEG
jgi:non-lysosomal glucosylceramidase